jgi:hypothetical protein
MGIATSLVCITSSHLHQTYPSRSPTSIQSHNLPQKILCKLPQTATMKFLVLAAALATTALAASAGITGLDARHTECTPPSYACKSDHSGWLVCNVDGTFLVCYLISFEETPVFMVMWHTLPLLLRRTHTQSPSFQFRRMKK